MWPYLYGSCYGMYTPCLQLCPRGVVGLPVGHWRMLVFLLRPQGPACLILMTQILGYRQLGASSLSHIGLSGLGKLRGATLDFYPACLGDPVP